MKMNQSIIGLEGALSPASQRLLENAVRTMNGVRDLRIDGENHEIHVDYEMPYRIPERVVNYLRQLGHGAWVKQLKQNVSERPLDQRTILSTRARSRAAGGRPKPQE